MSRSDQPQSWVRPIIAFEYPGRHFLAVRWGCADDDDDNKAEVAIARPHADEAVVAADLDDYVWAPGLLCFNSVGSYSERDQLT